MISNIAINGFGRIGRLVFRKMMAAQNGLHVVAINDIAPLDNLVYLLKHDSVQREPEAMIEVQEGYLVWNEHRIPFLSKRNPENLPWNDMDVDLVVEASGIFTDRKDAGQHLEAGAKRVLVSAPSKGADVTICMGVNEEQFKPYQHLVVSNASCTTNCLAPVAKVLDEEFGIVSGFLTTIHAYTSSQSLVDAPSKKWRRGRAAAVSIVPTTTGAAIATTEVLPQLQGRMDGLAIRVPVPAGSIIDFVVQTEKDVTKEIVNDAFRAASISEDMRGILGVSDEELVSADIIGTDYSAVVDAASTMVIGPRNVKVLAWYDNEWAFSQRVVDLASYMCEHAIVHANE